MKRKSFRFKYLLSALVIAGVPLFFYQNCGKSFDSALDSGKATISKSDALKSSAPFAFETQLDTISYNSCFGSTLANRPNYFTLRASSHKSGGVRIKSEFFDYARQALKPSYPSTVVTDEQVKALLAESDINKNVQPQFSIRRFGDLATYTKSGGAPNPGIDYSNLLGSLTEDRWMGSLLSLEYPIYKSATATGFTGAVNLPYLQYFPLALTAQSRNVAATITWNDDEARAVSVRNLLNADGMIAITYTDANLPTLIPKGQTSADDPTAYGVGYRMQFGREIAPYTGGGSPYAYNPDNILSQVEEIDLNTGRPTAGTWNCSYDRRYLVVRPNDRATMCPEESYAAINNVTFANELAIVRRHFPADQWDVNLTRRCVVPKDSDCYAQEKNAQGQLVAVEYNQRNACFQSIEGIPYGNNIPVPLCAQYVSICIRN
ncbi:MAG: hypothetical protein V4736_15515 [Bdellovibrionota bacterium]